MKKQIIRLTESDLHRIIRKSVNKIIREAEGLDADEYFDEYWHREHGNADDYLKPYGKMPEGYDDDVDIDTADIIAGLNTNDESEIYPYLKGIENKASWSAFDADRNYRMDGGDEPYDSYAYQGERNPTLGELGNFNVHESRINRIIKESVKRILRETDCAGVMQTGSGDAPKGTNPEAGQYPTAFGPDKDTADRTPGKVAMGGRAKWNVNNGNVQRREIYNPKSGKKR
jgi:hypothetical protein